MGYAGYHPDETVSLDHDGIQAETELAVLFDFDGDHIWVPKSQIVDYGDDWVEMTEWIAEQKGLA